MKFIYTKMKGKSNTISFFFNARGDGLEKSLDGMYRSLLLQVLQQLPSFQQEHVFEHHSLLRTIKPGSIKWDTGILQALLSHSISHFGQQELTCFVDALDECREGDVDEMVKYFETLSDFALETNVTLFICLSSRHYPSISIKDGITLTLENQPDHNQDLKEYVNDKLTIGSKNTKDIRDKILDKSAGVFLWIVLVVNILNKEYRRGRIFAVRERLGTIPPTLKELFKDMLKRDSENMDEFRLSIQWILFAKYALVPQEYYYAMLAGLDYGQSELGEWDPKEVTEEDMERYVVASSKGLAEVIKTLTPKVQFIHESVRDFLLKDGGTNEIWSELEFDFPTYSHNKLAQCCYTYLRARESDVKVALERLQDSYCSEFRDFVKRFRDFYHTEFEDFVKRFPFAKTAVKSVAYHSSRAATGFSQHCLLESFDFGTWARLSELCFDYDKPSFELCEDLAYLVTWQSPVNCCEIGNFKVNNIAISCPEVLL
ncbi:hypothetical protein F5B22DRAFT_618216 [Xylaria bambusicola]|uniref:uncharacterized protein n=1 Tax=Xylaria bambusicola TaxID=326684 RepID=UPI0020082926|nr:uncharacterized protein F5B22DRAFT_618216 [Xylaria bambusicola]KAI0509255.1 hypothetical protein F5B22DRAFT_618216 [Xylaria bambusicola]